MKQIAALVTTYYPASHADVIVTRWMEPVPTDPEWGWVRGDTRIASLYVAQHTSIDARQHPEQVQPIGQRGYGGDLDLSYYLAEKHGIPVFDTIHDALTLGGDRLAVDGVLLVAEHGDYPYNERGQKLYPRKEFWDQIVAVFEASGRSVPVFCDKHLSWNPDWAQEMVDTARNRNFALMAGSSLPHIGNEPPVLLGPDASVTEYVGLFYVGPETYGFHSLEMMEDVIERRAGGETGIGSVCAFVGDAVWEAMDRGQWSRTLFDRALRMARTVTPGDVRQNCNNIAEPRGPSPVAFQLRFHDGLTATHVCLAGAMEDFTFAVQTGDGQVHAALSRGAYCNPGNHYANFAPLCAAIEQMFLTGVAPTPVERTLLTTKTIAACMYALQTPGVEIAVA